MLMVIGLVLINGEGNCSFLHFLILSDENFYDDITALKEFIRSQ